MSELNKLDKLSQLEIIESFGALTSEQLEGGLPEIGKIHRGSKVYYRLRTGDYRIYFELLEEEIRETPYNWLWSHKRWKK